MPKLITTIACLVAPLAVLSGAPAAQAAATHARVPQAWAKAHHVAAKQGARDSDKDGLSNWGEYRAGTNPRRADSDRDGVFDALEDRDRDGLVNADELAAGTDPRRRDSDRDGIADGREDRDRDGLRNGDERSTGHDLSKPDSDADGVRDGRDNAGTITAASATSITIRLSVGGTLTASLSGDSWVDCTSTAVVPSAGDGAGAARKKDSGGSADSTQPSGDSGFPDAATDPDLDPTVDSLPVEDDPAMLASVAQAPDDAAAADDSADWGTPPADTADTADAADAPDAPDLGSCGPALRTGAIVHKATVDGSLLSELELMKA